MDLGRELPKCNRFVTFQASCKIFPATESDLDASVSHARERGAAGPGMAGAGSGAAGGRAAGGKPSGRLGRPPDGGPRRAHLGAASPPILAGRLRRGSPALRVASRGSGHGRSGRRLPRPGPRGDRGVGTQGAHGRPQPAGLVSVRDPDRPRARLGERHPRQLRGSAGPPQARRGRSSQLPPSSRGRQSARGVGDVRHRQADGHPATRHGQPAGPAPARASGLVSDRCAGARRQLLVHQGDPHVLRHRRRKANSAAGRALRRRPQGCPRLRADGRGCAGGPPERDRGASLRCRRMAGSSELRRRNRLGLPGGSPLRVPPTPRRAGPHGRVGGALPARGPGRRAGSRGGGSGGVRLRLRPPLRGRQRANPPLPDSSCPGAHGLRSPRRGVSRVRRDPPRPGRLRPRAGILLAAPAGSCRMAVGARRVVGRRERDGEPVPLLRRDAVRRVPARARRRSR